MQQMAASKKIIKDNAKRKYNVKEFGENSKLLHTSGRNINSVVNLENSWLVLKRVNMTQGSTCIYLLQSTS